MKGMISFSRSLPRFGTPSRLKVFGNLPGGWLHFAGEHTSYAFIGYMEGALSSGYRLRNLAIRDHIFPA